MTPPPLDEASASKTPPADSLSYELRDDERPTDPSMPQNRLRTVEGVLQASSMIDTVQQGVAVLDGRSPSAMSLLGYKPPKVGLCANTHHTNEGSIANCKNDGKLSCSKCHLV